EPFRYYPGQYLDFILKDGRHRSYSMATPPNDANQVELHIRHTPGGAFTDHVFGAGATKMKVREILRVEAPLGSFFLRQSEKPAIFLASGTGFAPIKAMVQHMIAVGDKRPVRLYWGGRRPFDLYMDAVAKEWESQLPDFQYVPVVSEARDEDMWQGRTGFVHRAVMEDFPDLSGHQVYACGVPVMVDSARRDFVQQCRLPQTEVYADSFTTQADLAAPARPAVAAPRAASRTRPAESSASASPESVTRPGSMSSPRAAASSASFAFCSTSRIVTPARATAAMVSKIFDTMSGASPIEGSSSSR